MPIEVAIIDGRVVPNGRDMFEGLPLQNKVGIPLIPRGGDQGQVLTKFSDLDYDLYWADAGITNALNGLRLDPVDTVKLGGLLIEDTTVTGANTWNLSFNEIATLRLEATTEMYYITPNVPGLTGGEILQLQNATGLVEFTPYNLPLTDGTAGQILETDGAGNISWVNNTAVLADSGTEIVSGTVYLGGTLLRDTTILGDTFSFTINNVSSLILNSNNLTGIESDSINIDANTSFALRTPEVNASTRGAGAILQLLDAAGTAEFTPFVLPTTDGLANQILQTDGLGNVTWVNPTGAGLINSENGLTDDGTTVKLGGTLIENTVLSGATFNFELSTINEFRMILDGGIYLTDNSDTPSSTRTAGLLAFKSGAKLGAIKQEEVLTIHVAGQSDPLTTSYVTKVPIPPSLSGMSVLDVQVDTITDSLPTPGKTIPFRLETRTGTSTIISGSLAVGSSSNFSTAPFSLSGINALRIEVDAATGGDPGETANGFIMTIRLSA